MKFNPLDPLSYDRPTATQWLALVHDTAINSLSADGDGAVTRFQAVPFQCCTNVCHVGAVYSPPTATQNIGPEHEMSLSSVFPPTVGNEVVVQEPFWSLAAQATRSAVIAAAVHPTATHDVGAMHDTPCVEPEYVLMVGGVVSFQIEAAATGRTEWPNVPVLAPISAHATATATAVTIRRARVDRVVRTAPTLFP